MKKKTCSGASPKKACSRKNASVASRFSRLVITYQVSGFPNFSPARRIEEAKYSNRVLPVTGAIG
ncbi:MAG: hypothetical protein L6W00_08155 [Lentisphaeria bacterium]|nr:MAG: hypothetical protein L6W00_08155 [Lentisphaeria bacterium]